MVVGGSSRRHRRVHAQNGVNGTAPGFMVDGRGVTKAQVQLWYIVKRVDNTRSIYRAGG